MVLTFYKPKTTSSMGKFYLITSGVTVSHHLPSARNGKQFSLSIQSLVIALGLSRGALSKQLVVTSKVAIEEISVRPFSPEHRFYPNCSCSQISNLLLDRFMSVILEFNQWRLVIERRNTKVGRSNCLLKQLKTLILA
jgi:hypothetical protein